MTGHAFDMTDGWCHVHREPCSMVEPGQPFRSETGATMRVQTDIGVDVTIHYLDIKGLQFQPQAGSDRVAEFHALRATARLDEHQRVGRVYLSGLGKWVRKDGTIGKQDAKLVFSSGTTLPSAWWNRIHTDLEALADLVIVGELRPVGCDCIGKPRRKADGSLCDHGAQS